MLLTMPTLADNAIVNRLEPATRDAVLICAAAIARLEKQEQRAIFGGNGEPGKTASRSYAVVA
jgi:hypothetical protein